MNQQQKLTLTLDTFEQCTDGKPPSTHPPLKSPGSEEDTGTSHRSQSTLTKGSLEWLKAKRESWKSSQSQKLVDYPSSEGDEIQKVQQALDLLCAIQTGKADASTIVLETNSNGKLQSNQTHSPELSTRENHNRERLVAFYEKYNPSKLATVDETLEKYRGQEEELFRKLEAKYAKDPYLPATGTGPKCFMEFSTGGRVTFELFQDKAPFATKNFLSLCTGETGVSYRNCIVHRIVPNFCIQAGDFTKGDGTGGRSIFPKASPANPKTDMWGNFEDETPFLRHDAPGLLSMANNGPNRNSSQFFVTLRPLQHLNGKHVVFGRVTRGMEVVEKLSQVETNTKTQRPVEPLRIIDCGEIAVDQMDATTKKEVGANIASGLTHVLYAANTSTPSALPSSARSNNESIVKSLPLFNSSTMDFGSNQEEIESIQTTIESKDNNKQKDPPKDDFKSNNRDPNLCAQIKSCLQQLELADASDIPVSSQVTARNKEKGGLHSSLDSVTIAKAAKNQLETLSSNPVKPKIQNNSRSKPTIATLLLDDPLGLSLMFVVKGKEKALMQPIPQLHCGAVFLKCVKRSSKKKLNSFAGVLGVSRSTSQHNLKYDPLAISFSIHATHNQTPER